MIIFDVFLMYLRNSHPLPTANSILQLTGQVYLQMCPSAHAQQSAYEHAYTVQKQNNEQLYRKNSEAEMEVLKVRMSDLESMLCRNISTVNEQTLATFHEQSAQMNSRLNDYEGSLTESTKKNRKEEEDRNKQMMRRLEVLEETVQIQEQKQYKVDKLTQKLQKCLGHTNESITMNDQTLELQQKMEKINTIMHQQEQLQQQLLQLQQYVGDKLSDPIDEVKRKREKELEKVVDRTTPFFKNFRVRGNNITKEASSCMWHQVLLGQVIERQKPFVLHAHITHTLNGNIFIGVVDRSIQRTKQSSFESGNTVSYYGYNGCICYGQNGKCKYIDTNMKADSSTHIRLQIHLSKGRACITIDKQEQHQQFEQECKMLVEQNREFVPYFEMYNEGDSITWAIQ